MANNSSDAKRDAILVGMQAASELHKKLGIHQRISDGASAVDVYSIVEELGIILLFKDLDGPLGLCIKKPVPGILINRGRPHMMQRFTAAHELGHIMLDHGGSIDHRVFQAVSDSFDTDRELEEVSADAFASEFLFPQWLYVRQTRAMGWASKEALRNPKTVYQLSLRMGGSFEATAWGLNNHKIFSYAEFQKIRKSTPKEQKIAILGTHELANPWNDAWILGPKDNGRTYAVRKGDYIAVELPTMTGAGFYWEFMEPLPAELVKIAEDVHLNAESERIGGASVRRFLLHVKEAGTFTLNLNERRGWSDFKDPKAHFQSTLLITNPEIGGLPNISRQRQRLAS